MKSRRQLPLVGAVLVYGSLFLVATSLLAYRAGVDRCITEQQTITAGDLALVTEFQKRVQDYVALHRRLEGPLPTLEVSDDPKKIYAAIEALQGTLRAARINAKRGDIFTDDIAHLFRRLIREALSESETRQLLAAIAEETTNTRVRPRVNAPYPGEASLSIMPPKLLCAFPELPEELQYRIVDRDLILWDVHANLIVDVVPNAILLNET